MKNETVGALDTIRTSVTSFEQLFTIKSVCRYGLIVLSIDHRRREEPRLLVQRRRGHQQEVEGYGESRLRSKFTYDLNTLLSWQDEVEGTAFAQGAFNTRFTVQLLKNAADDR